MALAPQLPPSGGVVHAAFNGEEAILADFAGDFRSVRRGHNPFVLVNYSPTICLNPLPDLS